MCAALYSSDTNFDPNEKDSWYFGAYSREDANRLLENDKENGVFLVRDSNTLKGDLVLCLREDKKNSHYIINKYKRGESAEIYYRIGEQDFTTMAALLEFYQKHYLEKSNLIRVARREQFITLYPFQQKDPEDLSFKKGEILTLLIKDEADWWTCRNSKGQKGLVPVNYLEKYNPVNDSGDKTSEKHPTTHSTSREVPFIARAIQKRVPLIFNQNELSFDKGDSILVERIDKTGTWYGKKLPDGPSGEFPFTFVKITNDDD